MESDSDFQIMRAAGSDSANIVFQLFYLCLSHAASMSICCSLCNAFIPVVHPYWYFSGFTASAYLPLSAFLLFYIIPPQSLHQCFSAWVLLHRSAHPSLVVPDRRTTPSCLCVFRGSSVPPFGLLSRSSWEGWQKSDAKSIDCIRTVMLCFWGLSFQSVSGTQILIDTLGSLFGSEAQGACKHLHAVAFMD